MRCFVQVVDLSVNSNLLSQRSRITVGLSKFFYFIISSSTLQALKDDDLACNQDLLGDLLPSRFEFYERSKSSKERE